VYLTALLMFLAGWWLSQYRYLSQSQSRLEQWESQVQVWQLQLRHHSDLVVESQTQLELEQERSRLALEKAMLRQSELEMALDFERSKAMVSRKALDWDLQ
jgi:hypothetical protein